MAIVTVVVEQHAEEASFLWLLRDAAVSQPHYSLADLAKLDNRVEAHLDGLRVAGNAGWEICKKAMEEGDAGEVFAAAVLAFESMEDEHLQAVLKVGAGTPEVRGLVSALGWLSFAQAESHIKRLVAAGSPVHRRVGIAAGAVQRQHLGQALM